MYRNLGRGIYQSNYFLLCLLSFSFSPNEHKDTDKRRAHDSGFPCLLWGSYDIMRENTVKFNSMMNKY